MQRTPLLFGFLAAGSLVFSMLVIPVISSAEIEGTYSRMIAENNDPTEKRKLEASRNSAVEAQKGREISGFTLLAVSGISALISLGSWLVEEKK